MSGPSDDLTRINSDNAESQAVFEAAAEYASQNDKLLTKISQDAGVDPGDARDVIHGVLLEVIQNPDTFRKARNLGTFLRKRVQWRARDHRKAKSKHREVPLHDSYDVEDHRAAIQRAVQEIGDQFAARGCVLARWHGAAVVG